MLAIFLFSSLYIIFTGCASESVDLPAKQAIALPFLPSNQNLVQYATKMDSGTQDQGPTILKIKGEYKNPQEKFNNCQNLDLLENILSVLKQILSNTNSNNLDDLDKKVQVLTSIKNYVERVRLLEKGEADKLEHLLKTLSNQEQLSLREGVKQVIPVKRDNPNDKSPTGNLEANVIFHYKMPSINNLDCKEALAAIIQVINATYMQLMKYCIETGKCSLDGKYSANGNILPDILGLVDTKYSGPVNSNALNSAPVLNVQKVTPEVINQYETFETKPPGLNGNIENTQPNQSNYVGIGSVYPFVGFNKLPPGSETITDSSPKLTTDTLNVLLNTNLFPNTKNLNYGSNPNNFVKENNGNQIQLPDSNVQILQGINSINNSPPGDSKNVDMIKLLKALNNVDVIDKTITLPLNINPNIAKDKNDTTAQKRQVGIDPSSLNVETLPRNDAYMKLFLNELNIQKPSTEQPENKQTYFEDLFKLYKRLNNEPLQNDKGIYIGAEKPSINSNFGNQVQFGEYIPNYQPNLYQTLIPTLYNSPGSKLNPKNSEPLVLGSNILNKNSNMFPQFVPNNVPNQLLTYNTLVSPMQLLQQQKISSQDDINKHLLLLNQEKPLNMPSNPYLSNLNNHNVPAGLTINPNFHTGNVLSDQNSKPQSPFLANLLISDMQLADNPKHVNSGDNSPDSNRLPSVTNSVKSNIGADKTGVIELTYLLKQPKPLVYQPFYYVKYILPYSAFEAKIKELVAKDPQMMSNPTKLYQELLASLNLESSELKHLNNDELFKFIRSNGALVTAKVLNNTSDDNLSIVKDLNGKLNLKEVIKLVDKEAGQRKDIEGLDKAEDNQTQLSLQQDKESQNQIVLSSPQRRTRYQFPHWNINGNPQRYNSINTLVNPINLVNRIPLNVKAANNHMLYNVPLTYKQAYFHPSYYPL